MKKRLFLTFSRRDIDEPILSNLVTKYGVVFNIFGATVNDDEQRVALELEGDEKVIANAMDYLSQTGARIEEAEPQG